VTETRDGWDVMYETLSQPERHRVLDEIEAMSRENDTARTTWAVRVVGLAPGISQTFTRPLPWIEAIEKPQQRTIGVDLAAALLRRETRATDEEIREMRDKIEAIDPALWVIPPPAGDGDRPDAAHHPRRRFDALTAALIQRAVVHRGGGRVEVRATHRKVHEALAGETYDQRYERIKRAGGAIREANAGQSTTGPLIAGCPHCAAGER